jgi:hypothetical protein
MDTVFIKTNGPFGDKTEVEQNGRSLKGIRKIDVHMEVGHIVTADLEIFSEFHCEANGTFYAADPSDGVLKPVKRIEFRDGSYWEDEKVMPCGPGNYETK